MLWRGTLACSGLEESSLTLFDRWIRRRLPLPSTTPTSREIRPPCGTLSCSTRQGWAKPTAQIQQVLLMHVMTYMYCSSIYTICWIKISLSPGQLKCLCIAEIFARKNFTNTSTSRWRKFPSIQYWMTHAWFCHSLAVASWRQLWMSLPPAHRHIHEGSCRTHASPNQPNATGRWGHDLEHWTPPHGSLPVPGMNIQHHIKDCIQYFMEWSCSLYLIRGSAT